MTPERKAEVNRVLAAFNWQEHGPCYGNRIGTPHYPYQCPSKDPHEIPFDYTTNSAMLERVWSMLSMEERAEALVRLLEKWV